MLNPLKNRRGQENWQNQRGAIMKMTQPLVGNTAGYITGMQSMIQEGFVLKDGMFQQMMNG
jgi:hypothetical protein